MLTLDPGTLLALIHGEISVADALDSGVLAIDGDRAMVERFVGLFPMPEPAALPGRARCARVRSPVSARLHLSAWARA